MNNIIYPFSLPIYKTTINEDDFSQIKLDVFNFIKNNKENFQKPWDCPTLSSFYFQPKEILNSLVLNNHIKTHSSKYFDTWGFKNDFPLKIYNLWVNISPTGSFQESHNHLSYLDKCLFSGVLYIDVFENSGDLTLINPIESQLYSLLYTPNIHPKLNIPPSNRNLIMFPSFLDHYVGENKNPQPRISVSWNIVANTNNK